MRNGSLTEDRSVVIRGDKITISVISQGMTSDWPFERVRLVAELSLTQVNRPTGWAGRALSV